MKQLYTIFLCALLICTSTYTFTQTTRYVSVNGAGSGTSWADASGDLQAMIALSSTGDQVWVKAGTYTPGTTRSAAFSMKNGVSIYGSFAGTETLLTQRILTSGLTSILSGEIGAAGISDNCYHVFSNSSLNNTAFIDGFIIRDANDDRAATITDGLGGGFFNDGSNSGSCNPTIQNCLITNNQAQFGAGIFNSGYNSGESNPIITNCVISNNNALGGGGGIDNFGLLNGNASPIITNCVIYNNTAVQRAGGMYCWGGNDGNASPVVLNTLFINNAAIDGGGVVADRLNASGGSSGKSDPNFRNCIFWGNTASGIGPQFFILGDASFVATYSNVDLTNQSTPHTISGVGTGNINTNPLFVNVATGAGVDNTWFTSDDGLQLQLTSPCKDAGDNSGVSTTDLLSKKRIINSMVDMGAYEYNSPSVSVESLRLTNKIISVYPNPTSNIIHVDYEVLKTDNVRIELTNALGQVVYSKASIENKVGHQSLVIDTDTFAAGLYQLTIKTAGNEHVQKVAVVK
jgi:hypothetical protein